MNHGPEDDDFEVTVTNLIEDIPAGQQVTSTFDFSQIITKDMQHLTQSSDGCE